MVSFRKSSDWAGVSEDFNVLGVNPGNGKSRSSNRASGAQKLLRCQPL